MGQIGSLASQFLTARGCSEPALTLRGVARGPSSGRRCGNVGYNGCAVPSPGGRRHRRSWLFLVPSSLLLVCLTGDGESTTSPQASPWHYLFVIIVFMGWGILFGSFAGSLKCSCLARPAALKLLCVIVYITGDVGVFVANDFAGKAYHREMAMFCSAVISMVLGLVASWLEGGWMGLQDAMKIKHWIRSLPVASCFSLSLLCQMYAVSRLSSVLVKMLFQLKLPCTVLMSTLLLGQTYSFLQVNALAEIFLAVIIFTHLEVDPLFAHGVQQIDWRGGTAMLGSAHTVVSVLLNVLGSLLSERFFKEATSVSLYAKVAHIKAGELMVTGAMMFFIPSTAQSVSEHSGMLAGFDRHAWLVVGFLVLDSWMSIIVVKQLSSVVKALAKCVSLVLLFILSVAVFKTKSFQLMQFIAAMLVVNGSILYSYASNLGGQRGKNHERESAKNGTSAGCHMEHADADVDSLHRRRYATAERLSPDL